MSTFKFHHSLLPESKCHVFCFNYHFTIADGLYDTEKIVGTYLLSQIHIYIMP